MAPPPPGPGLAVTRQVTAVFVVFLTFAVKLTVWPVRTLVLVGEIVTLTGVGAGGFVTVTVALPTA